MKIILKDLLKLIVIFSIWFTVFILSSKESALHEALKYFPMHFIITIGYYAVMRVCYNMTVIKDCTKEYNTLLEEIEEARNYYNKYGIKYN
jgi:hypothetical protein